MTQSLQPSSLATLASATLVNHQIQFDTIEATDSANKEKFKAWEILRDCPPPGHLDVGQAMRNIEQAFPVQSELANQVDFLFKNFMELISTRFHCFFRSDEQWMTHTLQLSVLQSRLQAQHENVALETIWETVLFNEFTSFGVFEKINPPIGHEEIRTWLSNPDNSNLVQQIQHLDLNGLDLEALPPEIGLFSGLTTLILNGNKIRSLPESIGNLVQLQNLEASYNLLETIPDSIRNLKCLEVLDLTANALTEFPIALCDAESLFILRLGENRIEFLPDEIERLENLTKLGLWDNSLGELPDSIGNLPNLRSIDLAQNRLSSLPNRFALLENLEWVELSDNRFQLVPESLFLLSNLKMLGMEDNMISIIPPAMLTMPNLEGLYLSGNPIVFMMNDELNQFDRQYVEEDFEPDYSLQTISARYQEFLGYSCKTGFAKLLQAVGCLFSSDEVGEIFSLLEPSLKRSIESKIEELTQDETSIPSTALSIELTPDLLAECLNEVFYDRLQSLNPSQIWEVKCKAWELYNAQDNITLTTEEIELGPENVQLFWNILRHIDAVELVINTPEEGPKKKRQKTLNS